MRDKAISAITHLVVIFLLLLIADPLFAHHHLATKVPISQPVLRAAAKHCTQKVNSVRQKRLTAKEQLRQEKEGTTHHCFVNMAERILSNRVCPPAMSICKIKAWMVDSMVFPSCGTNAHPLMEVSVDSKLFATTIA